MSQGSQAKGEVGHMMIDPPGWAHYLVALAGIVVLIGPTLAVVWPR